MAIAGQQDPYEGINVNLDSEEIMEGQKPIPDVATNFVVASAERKRKEGSDFPYVALVLNPRTGDPKVERRKLFLNLSFHPDMLWQMSEFRRACGLNVKVSAGALLKNPNTDQEYVGCKFSTTPKIKGHISNPDRKVNEIASPFRKAF